MLNDPYMYLKLIFVLTTAITYLLTILVLICLLVFSKTDNSKMINLNYAAYLNTFKMSEAQVINLVGCWYFAVPGFGWTLINSIRVFIIA